MTDISEMKRNDFYNGSAREAAVRRLADYITADLTDKLERATRCCPNCTHWRQGPPQAPIEQCAKWHARPPAKVIAFGCDSFEDCIPF